MYIPPALPSRRQLLHAGLAVAAYGLAPTLRAASITPIEVWKDLHCGCCNDWIAHMQAHGFAPTVHDSGNRAIRAQHGLPEALGSCHTALVAGYVIEGHVPARDVHALLRQKPQALGLAVPGMPIGSPGMDGPAYGGQHEPYAVLLVQRTPGAAGTITTQVFRHYS